MLFIFIDFNPYIFRRHYMTNSKITTDGVFNINHIATLGGRQTILLNNNLDEHDTTDSTDSPRMTMTDDKVASVHTQLVSTTTTTTTTTTNKGLQSSVILQSETVANDYIFNTTDIYTMNDQTTNKSLPLIHGVVIPKNVNLATKQVFNNTQQVAMLTISGSKTTVPYKTVMLTEHLPYNTTDKENIITKKLLLSLTNTVNQDTLTVSNIATTVEDGATYTLDTNYVGRHDQALHNFFNFNWRLATIQL
jgi:hypothetical protein